MNAVEFLLGEAALARHAGRTALLCGEEAVTYRALAMRAALAAGAWRALGAVSGDRVLMLMRDTPEFAAAWLGALQAGVVAVAVNTKLSEAEFRHMRGDSGARLVLVEDVFAAARPDLTAEFAAQGGLVIAGASTAPGAASWRGALHAAHPAPIHPARAEDPAFWLYSSGTTGMPKGIIHAHRSVRSAGQAQREVLGLSPGDTVIATSKLFFAYALEHGLLGPLASGAASVLEPGWPDAEGVLAAVARHQPAAFFSVPTFYRRLLALGAERLAPFRPVRGFVAAGERLPAALLAQWREAAGGEILSLYGMSETFCAAVVTPRGTSTGPRTGLPLPGVEVRLAAVQGQAGPQDPGVLWLRHPSLALGYANRPAQTAAQFKDGWFCSQDLFNTDRDGYLCHQGRADEMVKVAGQWVQPGELEEAVAGDGAIAEAACVPVVDGEGFERLALFVAGRGDAAHLLAAAGRLCEERLPRHKRPKWIRRVAELPRTATGKVQRFKLRALLEEEMDAGNNK